MSPEGLPSGATHWRVTSLVHLWDFPGVLFLRSFSVHLGQKAAWQVLCGGRAAWEGVVRSSCRARDIPTD